MNDLEYLKNYSIAEIVSKTHLDRFTIKAILDKDFKMLLDVNLKMNIRVLEREYGIDFTEWLKEFNAYKEEHFIKNDDSFKIKPKVSFESKNKSSNVYRFFLFLILIILIIFSGFYYYFQNIENNETSISESVDFILNANNDDSGPKVLISKNIKEAKLTEDEIDPTYNSMKIYEENDDLSKKIKEKSNYEIEEDGKNDDKLDIKEEKILDSKEFENLNESENNKEIKEEIKEEVIENKIEEAKIEENKEKLIKKTEDKKQHKLFLNPKKKCWVSVKDLKTKETKNYMLEKGISFNKDSLIFIGNHFYTLELDGKDISIPNNNNARYILFKDGRVSFISQSEYIKLDKVK